MPLPQKVFPALKTLLSNSEPLLSLKLENETTKIFLKTLAYATKPREQLINITQVNELIDFFVQEYSTTYYAGEFTSYNEFLYPVETRLESRLLFRGSYSTFNMFSKYFIKYDCKSLADYLISNRLIFVVCDDYNKLHIFYNILHIQTLLQFGETEQAVLLCEILADLLPMNHLENSEYTKEEQITFENLCQLVSNLLSEAYSKHGKCTTFLQQFPDFPRFHTIVLDYNKQSLTISIRVSLLSDKTLSIKVEGEQLISLVKKLEGIFCANTDVFRKQQCIQDIEQAIKDKVKSFYGLPEDLTLYKNYEEPFSFFTDKLTFPLVHELLN